MPRFHWVGLTALLVACGGRSLLYEAPLEKDAGSSNDATGSSSGFGSSSGPTGSSGIGSSSGTGSSGSDSSSGSGSSSSSSSGSGSGGIAGGPTPSCTAPASSVPPSEVLPYVGVVQMRGACSASDIAGFITTCDSDTSTSAACNTWFRGASPTCLSCLGSTDAGISRTGGLDADYRANFLEANLAGCVAIEDGNTICASAYENVLQCVAAAGCFTCTDQASFQTCLDAIFATGGACDSYNASYNSGCMADLGDGGALVSGPCSDDTEVLSVICGNGSGDGG